jgi:hypothetical protein
VIGKNAHGTRDDLGDIKEHRMEPWIEMEERICRID